MNEMTLHILEFIVLNIFAYYICRIFSKVGSQECCGQIKRRKLLDIIFLINPCKYDGQTIPIFSLLQLAVLSYGAVRFLIAIILSPNESGTLLRGYSVMFMSSIFIGFFGLVGCHLLYIQKCRIKHKKALLVVEKTKKESEKIALSRCSNSSSLQVFPVDNENKGN